jgi:hypothetical protein
MDKVYAPEAWKRLGDVLEARRGQLGYGFRQREKFLEDRGGPPPSLKTLARLERGERASYPPGTVTRLESMYEWAPGSFERVLAGGDPVPLEGPPPPVPRIPFAPADVPEGDPKDDAAGRLFSGDTRHDRLIRNIWRYGANWEERLALIEVVDPKLAAALRDVRGQSEAGLRRAVRSHVQSQVHGNDSDTLRVSGRHRTVFVRHA